MNATTITNIALAGDDSTAEVADASTIALDRLLAGGRVTVTIDLGAFAEDAQAMASLADYARASAVIVWTYEGHAWHGTYNQITR